MSRVVRVDGFRVSARNLTVGEFRRAKESGVDELTFFGDEVVESVEDDGGNAMAWDDLDMQDAYAIIQALVSYNPNGRRGSR